MSLTSLSDPASSINGCHSPSRGIFHTRDKMDQTIRRESKLSVLPTSETAPIKPSDDITNMRTLCLSYSHEVDNIALVRQLTLPMIWQTCGTLLRRPSCSKNAVTVVGIERYMTKAWHRLKENTYIGTSATSHRTCSADRSPLHTTAQMRIGRLQAQFRTLSIPSSSCGIDRFIHVRAFWCHSGLHATTNIDFTPNSICYILPKPSCRIKC